MAALSSNLVQAKIAFKNKNEGLKQIKLKKVWFNSVYSCTQNVKINEISSKKKKVPVYKKLKK